MGGSGALVLQGRPEWWGAWGTGHGMLSPVHCLPHSPPRLTPGHSRKAVRNSRIVSQKADAHVCIMCLRAIMNYQVRRPVGLGGVRCGSLSVCCLLV